MTDTRIQENSYSDMLGFFGDVGPPMFDEATLANIGASGVGLIHMTSAWPFMDWEATIAMHRQLLAGLNAHDDTFQLIRTREDLDVAQAELKIGLLLGLQDPEFIGEHFERLSQLFDDGIRVIQIAYQREGPYGNGFLVDAQDQGLTVKGHEFVRRVNDAGIILDLSHTAPHTALDGLRRSSGPTMISHTCCRAVYNHPRGVTDEILAELVQHNNVIVGVLAMTFFLAAEDDSLDPMVRHICHLAEHIGTDRVVIGTDAPVGGFTDLMAAEEMFRQTTQEKMDPRGELKSRWPTHIPEVAENPHGFQRIGQALTPYFTATEIDGILGRNARNFFEQNLPTER